MIFSKISDNNIVKQFIIKELDNQILVCATESSHTENILKHISQIENYHVEKDIMFFKNSKGVEKPTAITKSSHINDITRNEYSYNSPTFLEFNHIFLKSNLYNAKKIKDNFEKVQWIDILSKQTEKRLTLSKETNLNLHTIFYKLNLSEQFLLSDPVLNNISCCYVIVFNNNLYYYIGSSIDILNRVKTHNLNLENEIYSVLGLSRKAKKSFFTESILPYYIESEISTNYELSYKIHPIYIYTNYLNKFSLLHPQHRLSKGEWILLKYITDLIIKILEQSLINKFKPKLNSIQKVGIRPLSWCDTYLDEISSEKSLHKVYGRANKYIIKISINKEYFDRNIRKVNNDYMRSKLIEDEEYFYSVLPPRTEDYMRKKYNLNIEEVLENINKLHHYKGCVLKQPMIIETV